MKKHFTKLIVALLALAMLLPIVRGCTGGREQHHAAAGDTDRHRWAIEDVGGSRGVHPLQADG